MFRSRDRQGNIVLDMPQRQSTACDLQISLVDVDVHDTVSQAETLSYRIRDNNDAKCTLRRENVGSEL